MTAEYRPSPLSSAGVVLGEDLIALSEALAKNAHERWAQQRLAEGWRYGPKRDDDLKQHPCLVPYESLPESEKSYDRTMALETLRVVVALGYVLLPPGGPAGLAALWRSDEDEASSEDVYQQVGERALQLGKPLLAYDIFEEAVRLRPHSPRLRQLQALALLRGGATERANAILAQLDRESIADEETLGLLARTHKDLGLRASDPIVRRERLTRAHEVYARAHRLTGGQWTGINAATLGLVIGRRETAAALAREVRDRCLRELATQTGRTTTPTGCSPPSEKPPSFSASEQTPRSGTAAPRRSVAAGSATSAPRAATPGCSSSTSASTRRRSSAASTSRASPSSPAT